VHSAARLSVIAVAIATLVVSTPAARSSQTGVPPQQPRFRADANFVRVDAYPTKGGSPVLDLTADEFEIFEDGALQKVETFEHVIVRAAGPQSERIEPGSQREMLQAAENPRNRVFVIFLDAPHVNVAAAHDINEPLIRLLNRILGPDDLVGVMTPEMSASDVVLGRKTQVLEQQLRTHWPWGRRFGLLRDERERAYDICYPNLSRSAAISSEMARAMIDRKRERATLEALQDLVRYLHAIREERKAILTVTEGWLLYREDPSLMKLRTNPQTGQPEPVPGLDPVGVGPDGKLTTKDPRRMGDLTQSECDTDRMRLAAIDDERFFRDILEDANRANATFYPIDPRGLPVFDNPIGPDPPPPPRVDQAMLTTRLNNLRTLAENTDGLAVLNSNDLDKGLKRIADDLTSYYLLGYHSTNTKLDGRFRSLKVRVKRPGVDVRARRGYRAATVEEVTAARAATAAPAPEAASAVEVAMKTLARIRPDSRVRVYATGSTSAGVVWIAGELPVPDRSDPASRTLSGDPWGQGANADLQVTIGDASVTSRVTLKPGERAFLTSVKLPAGTKPGEADVQARVTPADGVSMPASDAIRISVAAEIASPVMYRRGPATGNRQLPAADPRFSRSDRVHLELPAGDGVKAGAARLLDRTGQPLGVPVTTGERVDDATAARWITADVVLAPLAPGDYAIEVGTTNGPTESRVVCGIRVVR
jgi:VWFA-related protein